MTFPSRDLNHADPHRELVRLVRAYHEELQRQAPVIGRAYDSGLNNMIGAIIVDHAIDELYEELIDALEACEAWEDTHR
jgi:hypothetical protein